MYFISEASGTWPQTLFFIRKDLIGPKARLVHSFTSCLLQIFIWISVHLAFAFRCGVFLFYLSRKEHVRKSPDSWSQSSNWSQRDIGGFCHPHIEHCVDFHECSSVLLLSCSTAQMGLTLCCSPWLALTLWHLTSRRVSLSANQMIFLSFFMPFIFIFLSLVLGFWFISHTVIHQNVKTSLIRKNLKKTLIFGF